MAPFFLCRRERVKRHLVSGAEVAGWFVDVAASLLVAMEATQGIGGSFGNEYHIGEDYFKIIPDSYLIQTFRPQAMIQTLCTLYWITI